MADQKITQKVPKGIQQEVLLKVVEDLLPIEEQISAGGQQHITYEKNKYEHVGATTNLFPPIRVQKNGQFKPSSIKLDDNGSYVVNIPVPYTEEVENTRFPCGTYSLMVGNRYDLSVGTGGIGIATGGNMRTASGGRYNITAKHELNIASGEGNIDIKAAKNLALEAETLSFKTSNQVLIDSNLGVSKNAIINGCAFVDGELYVNHITCPAEVQYTGGGMGSFGQLLTKNGADGKGNGSGQGGIIGWADVSYLKQLYLSIVPGNVLTSIVKRGWDLPDKIPVMVCPDAGIDVSTSNGSQHIKNPEYSVFVYPHEHPFLNVPCTFTDGNASMRKKASSVVNSGNIGTASKIQHGYKQPVS